MRGSSFNIPIHFSAITLRQYVDWHNAENQAQRLAAALSVEVSEAIKISTQDALSILDAFEAVISNEVSRHQKIVKIDGVKYGFFPKIDNASLGEYIDLDSINTQFIETKNHSFIIDMMAICYRPVTSQIGDHYSIKDYDHKETEKHKKAIEQLTMDVVNGALLFFSTTENELWISSQKFLADQLKK